eukprot:136992-Prymnesium_polylepis.1
MQKITRHAASACATGAKRSAICARPCRNKPYFCTLPPAVRRLVVPLCRSSQARRDSCRASWRNADAAVQPCGQRVTTH